MSEPHCLMLFQRGCLVARSLQPSKPSTSLAHSLSPPCSYDIPIWEKLMGASFKVGGGVGSHLVGCARVADC